MQLSKQINQPLVTVQSSDWKLQVSPTYIKLTLQNKEVIVCVLFLADIILIKQDNLLENQNALRTRMKKNLWQSNQETKDREEKTKNHQSSNIILHNKSLKNQNFLWTKLKRKMLKQQERVTTFQTQSTPLIS